MKIKSSILIIALSINSVAAQNVEKAKQILDQLSVKTKTYQTVKANFSYTLENKADEIREIQEGTLITKDEKYFLSIGGQEIICDGKVIWTYLPDAGEVQISNVPSDERKRGGAVH